MTEQQSCHNQRGDEPTLFDGMALPDPPPQKPKEQLPRRKSAPPPKVPEYTEAALPPRGIGGGLADVPLERVTADGQMVFATRRVVLDPPKTFRELSDRYQVGDRCLADVFRIDLLFDKNHPLVTRNPQSWYAQHVTKLSEAQVQAVALFAELFQVSTPQQAARMMLQANTSGGKSVIALLCAAYCQLHGERFTFLTTNRALVSQIARESERFLKLPVESYLLLTGKLTPEKRRGLYEDMRQGRQQVHSIIGTVHTLANDLQDRLVMPKELGLILTDEIQYLVGDHPYVVASRSLAKSSNPLVTLSATTGPRRGDIQHAFGIDPGNYHVMYTPLMPKFNHPQAVILPESHQEVRAILMESSEKCAQEMIEISPRRELSDRIERNFYRKDGGFKIPDPEKLALMRLWLREQLEKSQEQGRTDWGKFGRMLSLMREFDHLQRLHMLVGLEGFTSMQQAIVSETAEKQDAQWVKRLYFPERAGKVPFADRRMKEVVEHAAWHSHQLPGLDHPKLPALVQMLKESGVFSSGGRAIISVRHAFHGEELTKLMGAEADHLFEEMYNQKARYIFEALRRDNQLSEVGVSFVAGGKHMSPDAFDEQLERFSHGESKILVGTSVMREGIHIPRADWLIHWSPSANGGYLLQWEGRVGRLDTSGSGDIRMPTITTLYTADTLENWVYLAGERNKEKVAVANANEDWG